MTLGKHFYFFFLFMIIVEKKKKRGVKRKCHGICPQHTNKSNNRAMSFILKMSMKENNKLFKLFRQNGVFHTPTVFI
jgi:hypothetical protein